jgi:hypothetical protein
MKAKRSHAGFGLYDLSRQIARRHQREIEETENPPRPYRLTPESFPPLVLFPARPSAQSRRLAA